MPRGVRDEWIPDAMVSPLLLPAFLLVLAMAPPSKALWDWLLAWRGGRFWPVPAALLPPILAASIRLMNGLPVVSQVFTATVLLAVIAVLQIYGQARAERARQLADAEISRIAAGVREQGAVLGSIAADVGRIADGIASGDEG